MQYEPGKTLNRIDGKIEARAGRSKSRGHGVDWKANLRRQEFHSSIELLRGEAAVTSAEILAGQRARGIVRRDIRAP